MRKRNWIIIAAVAVIGGAAAGGVLYRNKQNDSSLAGTNHSKMTMANTSSKYALNLMSGKTYSSSGPTMLHFAIEQNGKSFKGFQIDSTKLMHLIVVRKDRSNFQHVHPEYDSSTGMFMMSNFTFPTDGDYSVFANFAPTDAKKDMMGMLETEAPYVDVKVGNTSKVASQPLGADKLTSTANGITTAITMPPGGDSAGSSTQMPSFYAGTDGTVNIDVTKNGTSFTNLQEYLGSLGHMVVLGPNLEFIHAHPMLGDVSNQTGYIPFMITFPTSGQYKLYLQTQADNIVNTTDFNVTVNEVPRSSSGADNSMQGMDMSH